MPMYNDFAWREKGNTEICEYNSQTVAENARRFPRGLWSFLGPGTEKKWYGTYTDKPDKSWDRMAEEMMLNLTDSDHLILRDSSAFERGESRSKGGGKKSIHFNGSDENIELLLRTVISANQLSVYRAIADLCNELPKDLRAPGKPAAPDHLDTMEIPTGLSITENSTNPQQWRNPVQEYERKFEQLSEDLKLSKLCSDAGLKLVEKGHEISRCPEMKKGTRFRGWILKNTRIGPVLNTEACYHDDRYSIEVQIPSLFEDNTVSWVRIVNGVDKYATESMLTKKEEDTGSGAPIAKSKTKTEGHSNVDFRFYFYS